MSSVRMCDRCGTIFSEIASDWQTYRATTVKRDARTGTTYQVEVAMDACPDCSVNTLMNPATPKLKELPQPKQAETK